MNGYPYSCTVFVICRQFMRFDIITIFPESFDSYFGASILKRAREDGIVSFHTHNLRDFTTDKHKTVDDTPYGGGAGMVLKVQPIFDCVESLKTQMTKTKDQNSKTRTILLSAKGKTFTQQDAERISRYNQIILICGRYEGVDERVAEHIADEELSIGDYVLTGGELPAMIVADAVTSLLPGALGNVESTLYESHSTKGYREHPHYTKPEEFRGWKVPDVLLSGNHQEIIKWRNKI